MPERRENSRVTTNVIYLDDYRSGRRLRPSERRIGLHHIARIRRLLDIEIPSVRDGDLREDRRRRTGPDTNTREVHHG